MRFEHSAPGHRLHINVFPWNESRPKTFKKTVVTYMQVMAKGDIQVQSLGNFSNLWFRPVISSQWKVKRHIFWTFMIKFCPYFGKISKVALQSCNFVQHNQFCLKRAKIWHPISQKWMGIFKKKFHRCLFSLFCTKYLKIKKIWVYHFQALPEFLGNWLLSNKVYCSILLMSWKWFLIGRTYTSHMT